MGSKISNKIISQMFLAEIADDYTPEDIESARMIYITSSDFSLKHVCSFRSKCLDLVVETILMVYDNLEITNLKSFKFSIFRKFISDGDFNGISLTQRICEARPNFYINMLYIVCVKKENTNNFLSNISTILGFKNCVKVLKNKELWGLSRERTGFYTKLDSKILDLCLDDRWDITLTNRYKKAVLPEAQINDGFMNDDRTIELENSFTIKNLFHDSETYNLPFFLQDAFSLITGFNPSDTISQNEIQNFRNILNRIYEILHPLLLDLEIKNNFTNFIENIYNQDRKKLVFEEETNCDDSTCFTLFHILLKFSKGILNDSFINKIDDKKFPTFCFFYMPRLMEISMSKLLNDLKEDYNKKNTTILLFLENELIISYFNFVFNLIDQRQNEIFRLLSDFLNNNIPSFNEHVEELSNLSLNENFKDIKDYVFKSSNILDITLEDFKATKVSQILNDFSFLNTILSNYNFYLGLLKVENKSILTLINYLFAFKNTYRNDCLTILIKLDADLNKTLINRIVQTYSLRGDSSYYESRHYIHTLLKDSSFDINIETLRMFSICLGEMEENLSSIFEYIQQINAYNEKEIKLNSILNSNQEKIFLSEDEEKIELLPDNFLNLIARLSNEQIDGFFNSKFGQDAQKIKSFALDNLKYRNNEYKLKVVKKIRINLIRRERTELNLAGRIEYLNNILVFIKSHTEKNRKVFLNKNVFFRLFSILNSALNLLVGEKSQKIKIPKKESFKLDAKEVLRKIVLIINNMLNSNEKLIQSSGLNSILFQNAIDLCKGKNILNEGQLYELEGIKKHLDSDKNTSSADDDLVSLEDIPEEFLDPLTFVLMRNPVIMKTSKITIDLATFKQIMLNDQLDPFSRMPIDESMISPNTELKDQIDNYLSEKQTKK